jgi:MFS family permease
VLAALGFALAGLATHGVAWPLLLTGLFLIGCGNGLFSSPNTAAAMGLSPRDALGGAAALLSAARNAGVITGLGITGAIYTAAGPARADAATASIFGAAAVICVLVAAIAAVTYHTTSAAPDPDRLVEASLEGRTAAPAGVRREPMT